MTDARLLAEYARTGDGAAFAEVAGRHRPWVLAAARRLVRDRHAAEDVTQAVFVLMATCAAKLARHPRPGGWLLEATRRTAARARRTARRQSRREAWAAAIRWQWASRSSPSAGWDRLAGVLDEQVSALRRADREAIVLRFYQGKEMAGVAAALGVTEAAARKRVARAVGVLRARLRDRTGLDASTVPLVAWLETVARPNAPAAPVIPVPPPVVPLTKAGWLLPAMGSAAAIGLAAVAVVVVAAPPSTRPRPVAPAAIPVARAEQPPTDMTGRILAADGSPVAGANVSIAGWTGSAVPVVPRPTVVRSDSDGVYHIPAVPVVDGRPAVAFLVAWADGHGSVGTDLMALVPGRRDIRMSWPADLTVTFRRPEGRPAAGMPVHVVAAYFPKQVAGDVVPDGLNDRPPFRAVADANGRCTFADLPRGSEVRLAIEDDRYAQPDRDRYFPLPANRTKASATFDLTPAASISGRVTFGPTGKPVAGVGVSAWTPDGHQQTATVETAADGTYTLNGLLGGHYSIEIATNTGFWIANQMSQQWTSVAAADVRADAGRHVDGCDLKLIHGVVVKGRVVDDEGRPVANVDVGPAEDPSHGNNVGQMVGTDAAGAFAFRLPPGRAKIWIWNDLPKGFRRTDQSERTVVVRTGGWVPTVELRVTRKHGR